MKVMYRNYYSENMITESELENLIIEDSEGDIFFEWLNMRYGCGEVWNFTDEDKKRVRQEFLDWDREDLLSEDYERVVIDD